MGYTFNMLAVYIVRRFCFQSLSVTAMYVTMFSIYRFIRVSKEVMPTDFKDPKHLSFLLLPSSVLSRA